MLGALAGYSAKASTFYAMRAAAIWRAKSRVVVTMDRISASGHAVDSPTGLLCVNALETALHQWQKVKGLTLESAREISGRLGVAGTSKRFSLNHLPANWRQVFLALCASSPYRFGCVLLTHCGLRPCELQHGVTVRRRGPVVGIKIIGGKVRATAGQPWRGFFIKADIFPEWFLDDLQDATKVYAAPADPMRAYLNRLSPKVFAELPPRKQPILSAYLLRHALATDLRQQGWTAEEIGAVLGELSGKTSRWYGLRRFGSRRHGSVPSGILQGKVTTARPVKPVSRDWLWKNRGRLTP